MIRNYKLKYVYLCFKESRRRSLQIRASSEETSTSVDTGELISDLKEKVRNKLSKNLIPYSKKLVGFLCIESFLFS